MDARAHGAALRLRRVCALLPLAILCVLCIAWIFPLYREAVVYPPVALDMTGEMRLVDGMPRIDVNRAGAAMLTSIPGIGDTLAERIIADREMAGDYETLAALVRVSGIGDRKLAQIADFAACG